MDLIITIPDLYKEGFEKLIKHYEKLNIDPKTKTALFSDNLTFEKIEQLYNVFNNRIKTAFGIGTNLTNEVNFLAPQIVIKVVEANNLPVAKVSDSNGKEMCEDVEFLKYLKKIIKEKCKI